MKFILLALICCTGVLAVPPEEVIYESWVHYAIEFGKPYTADATTEAQYYTNAYHPNFIDLDTFINTDPQPATYSLGQTWYTDLSPANFKAQYLLAAVPAAYPVPRSLNTENLPLEKVWLNAVTPSVTQTGQSWAYAAVAAVEAFFNKGKEAADFVQLSVKQLLDCINDPLATPLTGLQWIKDHGIDLEADYQTCTPKTENYKIPDLRVVKQDINQVKAALQLNPVTVCFDLTNFQQYTGDVINQDCDAAKANYCGLLYGYENDEWIIKTSLGTKWGVEGDLRIKQGAHCGVNNHVAFPMHVNEDIQDQKDDFEAFKLKFNKQYATPEEEQKRFQIYAYSKLDNQDSHFFGETPYTDLTAAEFKAQYLIADFTMNTVDIAKDEGVTVDNIDWRTSGIVTDVFHQGTCISSWAIAAKNALESYFNQQTSKKVKLSLQQLIDCSDPLTPLQGCTGGVPQDALQWIKAKGLHWESEYPYTGKAAACASQTGTLRPANYQKLADTNAISAALGKRPVIVCFDASQLQNYSKDIITQTDCGSQNANYCGLLVGKTPTYWIVQGSLGADWGVEGYVHIQFGNNCGIGSNAYTII